MSFCNKNYLSIQEPLSMFCVFRSSIPFFILSAGVALLFYSNSFHKIIKHETFVPREKEKGEERKRRGGKRERERERERENCDP